MGFLYLILVKCKHRMPNHKQHLQQRDKNLMRRLICVFHVCVPICWIGHHTLFWDNVKGLTSKQ